METALAEYDEYAFNIIKLYKYCVKSQPMQTWSLHMGVDKRRACRMSSIK